MQRKGDAMNHPGFNPQQLVARGVFDSIEEADAVLCRLDEARARATIMPEGWRRGMAFDVPISAGGGFKLQSGSSTRSSLAPAPAGSFTRDRMVTGGEAMGSLSFPSSRRGAGAALSNRPAPSLCPWCALERAYQGQGAAPRTGFVAVTRCARHASESSAPAVQSAPMPHNSPGGASALSHAATPGFPINPNAGAVQAFPKGRWS